MNVIIINQPIGNRGDEAAHRALIREINKTCPTVYVKVIYSNQNQDTINQIKVVHKNNEYVNFNASYRVFRFFEQYIHGIPSLYFLWGLHPITRKMISYVRWADIVVCAPGGICMGGFMNWSHVTNLAIAKYYKKKIVYFCRSIGPFSDDDTMKKVFKKTSVELLKSFDYISLRDKKSQLLAETLQINYQSTTDAAFMDDTNMQIPTEIQEKLTDRKYIVFVPNSLNWHYYYKNTDASHIKRFYLNIISYIDKKYPDLSIVLVPQTFNNPTGNDVEYFRELKNTYKSDKIIVIDDIYGSDIQQAIINRAEFVIGARYHTVVFSINQSVPFCALSYEHKIEGLLELLSATDNMVDIKDIFNTQENIEAANRKVEAIINSFMKQDNQCVELNRKAKDICKNQ